ncbi:MAG: hypothetical protein Q9184_007581 [Pyrenodesmia sp. 2 TL-2023]
MARTKNNQKAPKFAEKQVTSPNINSRFAQLNTIQQGLKHTLRGASNTEIREYSNSLHHLIRLLGQREAMFKAKCLAGCAWNKGDTPISDSYGMLWYDAKALLVKTEDWAADLHLLENEWSEVNMAIAGRVPISIRLDGIYSYQQSLEAFVELLKQRIAVFQPRYSKSRTPTSRLYAGLRNDARALLVKAEGWLEKVNRHYIELEDRVLSDWGYDVDI